MKTPEEIRKGLDDCLPRWNEKELTVRCDDCAYKHEGFWCRNILFKDASTYIQKLESENEIKQKRIDELESSLAQVERERDAAVKDLSVAKSCKICKNYAGVFVPNICMDCIEYCNFEWRGPCPANTKKDKT